MLLVCVLLFAWAASTGAVQAQHGALQGQALIDVDGRYGAAILADALWLDGCVRVGASVGTGALSNGGDERSGVLGVFGPTLWLGQPETTGGMFGLVRVGGFAGGRKGGFFGGGWLAPALGYRVGLGSDAMLRLALEGWLLVGESTALIVSPALGLAW